MSHDLMQISGKVNEKLSFAPELNQLIGIATQENDTLKREVIKQIAAVLEKDETPSFKLERYFLKGLDVDYTHYYGEELFHTLTYAVMGDKDLSKVMPGEEVEKNVPQRLSGVLGSILSTATQKRTIDFDKEDFVRGEAIEEGMKLVDTILEKLGKNNVAPEEKVKTARDAIVENINQVIAEELAAVKEQIQQQDLKAKYSSGNIGPVGSPPR